MARGWEELLCADLAVAFKQKWLFVESNQYFASALLANPHYAGARSYYARPPAHSEERRAFSASHEANSDTSLSR